MKREKFRRLSSPPSQEQSVPEKVTQKKPRKKKEVHHAYMQVGVSDIDDRKLRYSDIPKRDGGWVGDLQYRPINFDLVFLKIEGREKTVSGWWTGTAWEGRLWKSEYKVLAWKRNIDWD